MFNLLLWCTVTYVSVLIDIPQALCQHWNLLKWVVLEEGFHGTVVCKELTHSLWYQCLLNLASTYFTHTHTQATALSTEQTGPNSMQ